MAEQNIDDKENKAIETDKEIILEVKDVKKWFPNAAKSKEYIKAVDGVSLSIRKGETFGLVRVAIQNFLKNPVISTVLGFRTTSFLA